MLIYDIETEPLAVDDLKAVCDPFDSSTIKYPGKFDPSAVKMGNLKDEAKRQAKIDDARAAHEKAVAEYELNLRNGEEAYWAAIRDKAALCATTGRVCAIGYRNDSGTVVLDHILDRPEPELLRRFWEQFAKCRAARREMVGFNSNRFDVPFLARRSWVHGIAVPPAIFTPTGYLCPTFVDLLDRWQCGDRRTYVSLNRACRALGIGGKPDDCTGSQFHELLRLQGGHEAALNYLANDLEMTFRLAERLGAL